ncbi:hypothetical protein AEGHOMDF_3605 [Methylobacterium soli]|nr:hypothetical protein AEGHOMDF_3605 [Methylobacterium soli]
MCCGSQPKRLAQRRARVSLEKSFGGARRTSRCSTRSGPAQPAAAARIVSAISASKIRSLGACHRVRAAPDPVSAVSATLKKSCGTKARMRASRSARIARVGVCTPPKRQGSRKAGGRSRKEIARVPFNPRW